MKVIEIARDVVLRARLPVVFRNTAPAKKGLLPYLVAERNGELNDGKLRPPRLACVFYASDQHGSFATRLSM